MKKTKCLICKKEIIKDHNCRRFCSICYRQRRLESNRVWNKKWRETHKEENRKRHKVYSLKNKDKLNRYSKEWSRKNREDVLFHYGGKCECCGENKKEFLSIDHINGGGNKHRKDIGHLSICKWLKKNNYPKGFRILCHNCNMAKAFYGYCPHTI